MLLYEDKYFSSGGGVWKVAKRLGNYAILEGYKGEKKVILLVEGLTFEGTKLRWNKQTTCQSIEHAELEIYTRTQARKAAEKETIAPQQIVQRKTYVKGRKIKI